MCIHSQGKTLCPAEKRRIRIKNKRNSNHGIHPMLDGNGKYRKLKYSLNASVLYLENSQMI